MTLSELFAPYTTQEFPPKQVFCYVDDEVKSIPVDQIADFESLYKFDGSMNSKSITRLSEKFQLPILKRQENVL